MAKKSLALVLGFTLLGLLLAIGSFATRRLTTTPEERDFEAAFRNVEIGMSEQPVLELLGEPDERSPDFFLAQERGFEESYRRAAKSGATQFLIWRRGLDVVYTVGVNPAGTVTVAESGGT